jgi:phosphate transport system substrate-binding protein
MHGILRISLAAIAASLLFACPGYAREQIRIVGSSTVYPFAASVAEHFGKAGDFRTPVVEATGTGAGFKLFCEGVGDSYPDVTNASRRMLASERAQCREAGVKSIIEVKVGFDGITLAGSAESPLFRLTKKQIFLALARDVPKGDALVPNFYRRWRQIDPDLPDLPIKVYGTPPVSGTRDTFAELVMEKGCADEPAFAAAYKDESERRKHCQMMREDGAFIEAGENGNLIAQKLMGDPESLGIFGFSFLDQNAGRIHGSIIDGAAPTFESIQSGAYGISRPLYFYVKGEHLSRVPGLKEYTAEFLSEGAIGDEGYLAQEGLVPLPEAERMRVRQAFAAALANIKE